MQCFPVYQKQYHIIDVRDKRQYFFPTSIPNTNVTVELITLSLPYNSVAINQDTCNDVGQNDIDWH